MICIFNKEKSMQSVYKSSNIYSITSFLVIGLNLLVMSCGYNLVEASEDCSELTTYFIDSAAKEVMSQEGYPSILKTGTIKKIVVTAVCFVLDSTCSEREKINIINEMYDYYHKKYLNEANKKTNLYHSYYSYHYIKESILCVNDNTREAINTMREVLDILCIDISMISYKQTISFKGIQKIRELKKDLLYGGILCRTINSVKKMVKGKGKFIPIIVFGYILYKSNKVKLNIHFSFNDILRYCTDLV